MIEGKLEMPSSRGDLGSGRSFILDAPVIAGMMGALVSLPPGASDGKE